MEKVWNLRFFCILNFAIGLCLTFSEIETCQKQDSPGSLSYFRFVSSQTEVLQGSTELGSGHYSRHPEILMQNLRSSQFWRCLEPRSLQLLILFLPGNSILLKCLERRRMETETRFQAVLSFSVEVLTLCWSGLPLATSSALSKIRQILWEPFEARPTFEGSVCLAC